MTRLLVVDGSSVAVSLFYALGGTKYLEAEEVTQEEVNNFLTEVAETSISNITRRVSIDKYSQVRIALESPSWAPVWRYEIYPSYKYADTQQNKPKVARALQVPLIKAAEKEGIVTIFAPGMEADDVIATMLAKVESKLTDVEFHIWSHDKDLHQLITHPNVQMLGKAGEVTCMQDVFDVWGAPGEAVPLIKALAGDKSDNILGIHGIGPKKAAKMLVPKPHRKPTPYWIDFDSLDEDRRKQVLALANRILKDENLCVLKKNADLRNGNEYQRGELHGKKEKQQQ